MYESSFRIYKMLCCGIFCNIIIKGGSRFITVKQIDVPQHIY